LYEATAETLETVQANYAKDVADANTAGRRLVLNNVRTAVRDAGGTPGSLPSSAMVAENQANSQWFVDTISSWIETIPAGSSFEGIYFDGVLVTEVATVQQFVSELEYLAGVDAETIERLQGELDAALAAAEFESFDFTDASGETFTITSEADAQAAMASINGKFIAENARFADVSNKLATAMADLDEANRLLDVATDLANDYATEIGMHEATIVELNNTIAAHNQTIGDQTTQIETLSQQISDSQSALGAAVTNVLTDGTAYTFDANTNIQDVIQDVFNSGFDQGEEFAFMFANATQAVQDLYNSGAVTVEMLERIAADEAFHQAIAGGTTLTNELAEGSYEWDGTATGEVTYSDDYVVANFSTDGTSAQNWINEATGAAATVIFGDMSDGNGGLIENVVVYSTDSSLVGTAASVFKAFDGAWTAGNDLTSGLYSDYVTFSVNGETNFIIEESYVNGEYVNFFDKLADTKLEAYVEGYKQGFSDGYVSGYQDGYADGVAGRDPKH